MMIVYLEEGNVFIISHSMYALIFFNIDGLVIQQYTCNTFNI